MAKRNLMLVLDEAIIEKLRNEAERCGCVWTRGPKDKHGTGNISKLLTVLIERLEQKARKEGEL